MIHSWPSFEEIRTISLAFEANGASDLDYFSRDRHPHSRTFLYPSNDNLDKLLVSSDNTLAVEANKCRFQYSSLLIGL